ncbi:interleukin 19 like [Kryptolebias marmoratus]|uniref:Interleukin family protein n=1 Tax=Kryptolebias marmoratus TaxID=37003 RepID=A0A3Q3ASP3_KRYMA|nr:interleukin 19 like [Kryptolebias marmoratus]
MIQTPLGSFVVSLLVLLGCLCKAAEGRTLHVDGCSANVHFHELRRQYTDIRSDALSGDNEIEVKLLDTSLIKTLQEGQTCCFLRLLLRFYIERVFKNYESSHPHQQRCSSALANAFVSIRRDMHKCHCHCGEETQRTLDSVHTKFDKLQIQPAAHKAVGELNTLLDWMDGLKQTE